MLDEFHLFVQFVLLMMIIFVQQNFFLHDVHFQVLTYVNDTHFLIVHEQLMVNIFLILNIDQVILVL